MTVICYETVKKAKLVLLRLRLCKCDMRCSLLNLVIPFYWITVGVVLDWFGTSAMLPLGATGRLGFRKSPSTTRDEFGKEYFRLPRRESGVHSLPSFDKSIMRNVTTQRGQTGYLNCVVNNIEDKTVSWIRRRDFHVLTVGLDVYTSENRFETTHVPSTNNWILKINYAQIHDSGVYECQVSSDPKISFFVNLNVVVAVANIIGSPDLYVREGSSINLTCIISQSPEPPLFVFWYHDNRMINYDVSKVEINMQKGGEDTAVSRLFIRSAGMEDSGNYTCCPSNTEATSILVHVILDEKQEAIQHDSGQPTSDSSGIRCRGVVYLVLLWIIFCINHFR